MFHTFQGLQQLLGTERFAYEEDVFVRFLILSLCIKPLTATRHVRQQVIIVLMVEAHHTGIIISMPGDSLLLLQTDGNGFHHESLSPPWP